MTEKRATPALVVGMISVRDHEAWAEYRSRVPATLAPWSAELVARGAAGNALAGSHPHGDVVVIRFADRAEVQAWYDSAAYQAIIPLRLRAADVDLMVYDLS